MNGARELVIAVGPDATVSGLIVLPDDATALYVVAHGAGAGMHHRFMAGIADALATRKVGTLRYQFPYMERGSRRPDRPEVAQSTVRAAVASAHDHAGGLTLIAGGKSFGGRMTSQAQAAEPLAGVAGLAFLGFPLHPPGKPGTERGDHLADIAIPMLFLQGTRDTFARPELIEPLVGGLKPATFSPVDDADHGFAVPKRAGLTPADVLDGLADRIAAWAAGL